MKKEELVDYLRNLFKQDEISQKEIEQANECLDELEQCVKDSKSLTIIKSKFGVSPSVIDNAMKNGIVQGNKIQGYEEIVSLGIVEGKYYLESLSGKRYLLKDAGKHWRIWK